LFVAACPYCGAATEWYSFVMSRNMEAGKSKIKGLASTEEPLTGPSHVGGAKERAR
jgi:hypothetical protein